MPLNPVRAVSGLNLAADNGASRSARSTAAHPSCDFMRTAFWVLRPIDGPRHFG
jgi:hypothetical protein